MFFRVKVREGRFGEITEILAWYEYINDVILDHLGMLENKYVLKISSIKYQLIYLCERAQIIEQLICTDNGTAYNIELSFFNMTS